jgi:hypothetical protein
LKIKISGTVGPRYSLAMIGCSQSCRKSGSFQGYDLSNV